MKEEVKIIKTKDRKTPIKSTLLIIVLYEYKLKITLSLYIRQINLLTIAQRLGSILEKIAKKTLEVIIY